MTPQGFERWVLKAAQGRQIIYWQGEHLSESDESKAMREVAQAAYEKGEVTLVQKREFPVQGVTNRTRGTFAWLAIRI